MASTTESDVPPLWRDRSFWGMTITQFLGAFNDNLFKQTILLFCIDLYLAGGTNHQTTATGLFSLAFVLFSGFAGYLADKYSKRKIIVLCKVAEIVVMLLGLLAFAVGVWVPGPLLWMLIVVLCCMGIQSAFFGPSKYGILPEMLHNDDLPQANGLIQMTTFVAIIMGTALAGYGKESSEGALWVIGLFCVIIAVVGTLTSLLIRRTPIAKPDLQFQPSAMVMTPSTRKMLWGDKLLLSVLLISSLFWFVGGAVLMAVNLLGKELMQLGDGRTSILSACMGAGIGIGCLLAGRLSHQQINFKLVRNGAWGIAGFLMLVPLMGQYSVLPLPASSELVAAQTEEQSVTADTEIEPITNTDGVVAEDDALTAYWKSESLWDKMIPINFWEFATRFSLMGVGLFAGLFAVPLQTFMQSRPPADQKGQMIGAMNLINWIGILLSAIFLGVMDSILMKAGLSQKWIFPILAVMMIPVALFFKPSSEKLSHSVTPRASEPATNPDNASENAEPNS
ncbi:Lysophospholipid transporter LplT [Polystyrenella longa]|uniref:Lysophospholipid transporter LplT n=1 Tax=Polystyrenella longa TaxID=2528007 RepID=A0A518CQB3_9PLAN|nr:MFS transporter [Polystyrenella longa]QDU81418.1 Lysophospholipid transporter LplT [Polystyrenella longa]